MTEEERRHGMDEILQRLTAVETSLDKHVEQEARDRKEMMATLSCIKATQTRIQMDMAGYKGKMSLAAFLIGMVIAAGGAAAAWFR